MPTNTIADLFQQRDQFLSFIRKRVESSATAEDILQSAYVRAMEKSSSLRSGDSIVAWFYRVLRNAVIDHYRHRAAEDRAFDGWAQDVATETQPDSLAEDSTCHCVLGALNKLKPTYSEILREVELDGKSLEAVANATGITAGNAAVRVHRARQSLKKQLTLVCGTCCTSASSNCTCS
ncbi:RNA polymerase sigma factor [Edaphobacter bradus]|uniref:RNA polymerase sigma factor n=1 Tax=Edaphobacter bradus TaxID=2259016 RepID=UPI0021DF58CF|nr:sigma-70 family RNA polymerase sigma factor [Edaphobacter bradus]